MTNENSADKKNIRRGLLWATIFILFGMAVAVCTMWIVMDDGPKEITVTKKLPDFAVSAGAVLTTTTRCFTQEEEGYLSYIHLNYDDGSIQTIPCAGYFISDISQNIIVLDTSGVQVVLPLNKVIRVALYPKMARTLEK